jgi:hypothetical protein
MQSSASQLTRIILVLEVVNGILDWLLAWKQATGKNQRTIPHTELSAVGDRHRQVLAHGWINSRQHALLVEDSSSEIVNVCSLYVSLFRFRSSAQLTVYDLLAEETSGAYAAVKKCNRGKGTARESRI